MKTNIPLIIGRKQEASTPVTDPSVTGAPGCDRLKGHVPSYCRVCSGSVPQSRGKPAGGCRVSPGAVSPGARPGRLIRAGRGEPRWAAGPWVCYGGGVCWRGRGSLTCGHRGLLMRENASACGCESSQSARCCLYATERQKGLCHSRTSLGPCD